MFNIVISYRGGAVERVTCAEDEAQQTVIGASQQADVISVLAWEV